MNVNASIIGLEPIQARLRAAASAMQNLGPMLAEIGEHVVESTKLRFTDGGPSPSGKPWASLSRATIRNRRLKGRGGVQALLDTGRLRNSITKRVEPRAVWIGTNVTYAAVHQFGASIQHPPQSRMVRLRVVNGRSQFAKDKHKRARTVWGTSSTGWTVNIPARPYLGFSQDDQAEIMEIITRRIQQAGGTA